MKRVYECDTCRKQIELSTNSKDITLLNRCVITQGCKGGLHSTLSANNPQTTVDYQSRNVLYEHQQLLPSDTWTITHHLKSDPITYVYQDQLDDNGNKIQVLLDPDDYQLYYIDHNTTTVVFNTAYSGVVHSLARSSTPVTEDESVATAEFTQATANSILTIATKINDGLEQTSDHVINFVSPSTGEVRSVTLTFHSHKFNDDIALFNTPWKGSDEIYLGGYGYKVQSVRMDNVIAGNAIEDGSPFFFNDSDFLILLSTEPYSDAVDMERITYISPEKIQEKSLNVTAKVTGAELSIEKQHTLSYHPNIKVVKNTF